MKWDKYIFTVLFAVLLFIMFPVTASANSSWHWISSTRPFDLLPVVVIVTLIIEIIAVNSIAKVKDLKRVIPVVSIANIVSFLILYLWLGVDPLNVYSLYTPDKGITYAINYTLEHTPTYIVSFIFLAITLFAETPIVYLFFRKRVPNRKVLFLVIIAANTLTTAITFAIERLFCHGEW